MFLWGFRPSRRRETCPCDVSPCSLREIYWRFRDGYCFLHEGAGQFIPEYTAKNSRSYLKRFSFFFTFIYIFRCLQYALYKAFLKCQKCSLPSSLNCKFCGFTPVGEPACQGSPIWFRWLSLPVRWECGCIVLKFSFTASSFYPFQFHIYLLYLITCSLNRL
jgi:hypothetical protein